MKTETYIYENFPQYAVCGLAYGDFSGLEEEDIQGIEEFISDLNSLRDSLNADHYSIDYDMEANFSHSPEWGLPTDCIEIQVTFFNVNKGEK